MEKFQKWKNPFNPKNSQVPLSAIWDSKMTFRRTAVQHFRKKESGRIFLYAIEKKFRGALNPKRGAEIVQKHGDFVAPEELYSTV